MNITEFKNSIKHKVVEHNRTYLYTTHNGIKYGQSYQNTVNTIEGMINDFVVFYYPWIEYLQGETKQEYSLKKDHANIKKQIKGWELQINKIVYNRNINGMSKMDIIDALEAIGHDMTAINI